MTLTSCTVCGAVSERSTCVPCGGFTATGRGTRIQRGYGPAWARLSREARRLQPWCSDCLGTTDLTADHLRWPAVTVEDVQVTCRSCNSRRGPTPRTRDGRLGCVPTTG